MDPSASLNGPTYDNPVIVRVMVTGLISETARNDAPIRPENLQIDGSGVDVESGFNACYLQVWFRFSVQGTTAPRPCRYWPVPNSFWGDTALVQGTTRITRGPGIPTWSPNDCKGNPCHTYSGSQGVAITPLHVDLNLTASTRLPATGTSVRFTPSVTPTSIKGLAVPLTVRSWQWTAGGGGTGQTLACNGPANPCNAIIRESGSMRVDALANGEEQLQSAWVTAWNPPTACPTRVLPRYDSVSTQFSAIDGTHPDAHEGEDYKVASGTSVYAPVGGVVKYADAAGTAGITVVVVSPNVVSYFFHLQDVVVTVGQPVTAGQLLAHTDNTGHSTGPHLHFERHSSGPMWVKGHPSIKTAIAPCTF